MAITVAARTPSRPLPEEEQTPPERIERPASAALVTWPEAHHSSNRVGRGMEASDGDDGSGKIGSLLSYSVP